MSPLRRSTKESRQQLHAERRELAKVIAAQLAVAKYRELYAEQDWTGDPLDAHTVNSPRSLGMDVAAIAEGIAAGILDELSESI